MEITPATIIEEVLDPLMFRDLAGASPNVGIRRLADNAIELDVGLPDRVFVLTVEQRPRA